MQEFEKLGAFYLGRSQDPSRGESAADLILYDAKDLTTHAVIVGMTGSGKTGLGIGLLEEAALDHVPVIAVDPKGDLGNLLLTFPSLAADDFLPWVDAQQAAGRGRSREEYAAEQAALWRKGLSDWGQGPERIARLRDAVDMAIYTPGSAAGLPVSLLRGFTPPPSEIRDDPDLYRERIAATATGLLALLDLPADPLTSREHILLTNILQHSWDDGRELDIAMLIGLIQTPPMDRVGVMDMDAFFPPKERFALAMRLNNLLAAPGFEVWMQGQPLDAGALLHTPAGKPRVSVMSIAHLSDAERMFFVCMLLNELIAWMRRQPGTGSLRAILYMDEIFGYMPPTANPPSKLLLLTLLKQARAFGLGLVLATQNPVDLDYKGLSNIGTWFVGRLQTERDKARLMDGLEGAAAGAHFNRAQLERVLAGLGKRRFLLHNVHEDAPVVFDTRWVMSYLAGPMTREQIKSLMASRRAEQPASAPAPAGAGAVVVPTDRPAASSMPVLPPDVPRCYLPLSRGPRDGEALVYHPLLIGIATLSYANARYGIDFASEISVVTEFAARPLPVDWENAEVVEIDAAALGDSGVEGAGYAELPAAAAKAKNYGKWQQALKRWLRESQALTLWKSPRYKLVSTVGETEGEFRVRLQQLAHEQRDMKAGKLRAKYESKFTTLQDRLRRAEQRIEAEVAQSRQKQLDTAVAVGTAILGAFLGRKRIGATAASRAGSAARSAGRMSKEAADVERARESAQALRQQMQELTARFERDLAALDEAYDAQGEELEDLLVRPRSTQTHVRMCAVAWAPYYRDATGALEAAWP